MKNNEPTLNSIEDYNTLKGSKKRIVWTVILSWFGCWCTVCRSKNLLW